MTLQMIRADEYQIAVLGKEARDGEDEAQDEQQALENEPAPVMPQSFVVW
jgi:hypothetical protein